MSKMVPAVYEGARRPEAYLYRAFGLAAVAAELHLQLDMLEPGDAAAVQKGAAALFLAGFGPNSTRRGSSPRLGGRAVVDAAH